MDALGGWAGEQVAAIAALAPLLEERLGADGLVQLFEEVEMPPAGDAAAEPSAEETP